MTVVIGDALEVVPARKAERRIPHHPGSAEGTGDARGFLRIGHERLDVLDCTESAHGRGEHAIAPRGGYLGDGTGRDGQAAVETMEVGLLHF